VLSAALLAASRSSATRRVIERLPLTRSVVDRFVAGEHIEDAVEVTQRIGASGQLVTIDVLGEDVTDRAGAAATRDGYLELLAALDRVGAAAGADLSLKLSALGQALPGDGPRLATEHAREIGSAAAARQATITLDMENHTTVDATLAAAAELRAEVGSVGTVLQSNLHRTADDIAALADSGARIRLVKGAYREPASVAFQRKAEVDAAYRDQLDELFASSCYPMVATHDPAMIAHAEQAARAARRGFDEWELQMLYGIRTDLQERATTAGRSMRVYVPYGVDWYGYFMRRLAERPANVAFFLRALAHR
jgi:proline dehydrogenase